MLYSEWWWCLQKPLVSISSRWNDVDTYDDDYATVQWEKLNIQQITTHTHTQNLIKTNINIVCDVFINVIRIYSRMFEQWVHMHVIDYYRKVVLNVYRMNSTKMLPCTHVPRTHRTYNAMEFSRSSSNQAWNIK